MWAKMMQHFPRSGTAFFGFFGIHRGPVAQLGARFHGMEEVVGSIPTRSTKSLNGLASIAILIPKFLPVMLTCVAGTKTQKEGSIPTGSTKSLDVCLPERHHS